MNFCNVFKRILLTLGALTLTAQLASASDEAGQEEECIPLSFSHLPSERPKDCLIDTLNQYQMYCLVLRGVDKPVPASIAEKLNRRGSCPFLTRSLTSTGVFGACITVGAMGWLYNFIYQAESGCPLPEPLLINGSAILPYEGFLSYAQCGSETGRNLVIAGGSATAWGVLWATLGQRFYDLIARYKENLENRYQNGMHELSDLYLEMSRAWLRAFIQAHWKIMLAAKKERKNKTRAWVRAKSKSQTFKSRYDDETKENPFKNPQATLFILHRILDMVPDLKVRTQEIAGTDAETIDRIFAPFQELTQLKDRDKEDILLDYVLWINHSTNKLDEIGTFIKNNDLMDEIQYSHPFND